MSWQEDVGPDLLWDMRSSADRLESAREKYLASDTHIECKAGIPRDGLARLTYARRECMGVSMRHPQRTF